MLWQKSPQTGESLLLQNRQKALFILEPGNCYFQTIVHLDEFLEGRTTVDHTANNSREFNSSASNFQNLQRFLSIRFFCLRLSLGLHPVLYSTRF
jgi:hypothetical protein